MLRKVVVIAPMLVFAGIAASADPQTYPSRSIRLIVPYPGDAHNFLTAARVAVSNVAREAKLTAGALH